MGRRTFATVQRSFADEVASAFGFLANEFGFVGPELRGEVLPIVAFAGRGLRYEIMLAPDDVAVITQVEVDLGSTRLVGNLANLVPAAGLGSPNQIAQSAHTLYGLRRALASQARYVRLLQPHLGPETVVELLRAANAREWTVPH